ncbi:protein CBFA2T3-like [Pimephales promelas]|uniref:protein CBFA2T3-like n=1 Tax=Pimephales promelas TaxID=90988 RepID=UPI001955AB5F|nr:protein CBFA2T3-like [Pimephales promelas]
MHWDEMAGEIHARRLHRSGIRRASSTVQTVMLHRLSNRQSTGSTRQKAGTMPDSPADVKTQPRSTPPTMPPPPPAVSQAANRSASFTPTTSK